MKTNYILIMACTVLTGCATYTPPTSGSISSITISALEPSAIDLSWREKSKINFAGQVDLCISGSTYKTGKFISFVPTESLKKFSALTGEVEFYDTKIPAGAEVGVSIDHPFMDNSGVSYECKPIVAFTPKPDKKYFASGKVSGRFCFINILEWNGTEWMPLKETRQVDNCKKVGLAK